MCVQDLFDFLKVKLEFRGRGRSEWGSPENFCKFGSVDSLLGAGLDWAATTCGRWSNEKYAENYATGCHQLFVYDRGRVIANRAEAEDACGPGATTRSCSRSGRVYPLKEPRFGCSTRVRMPSIPSRAVRTDNTISSLFSLAHTRSWSRNQVSLRYAGMVLPCGPATSYRSTLRCKSAMSSNP